MMRNDSPDPEMERRLRDHFAAEAEDLQAPDDVWDRLEGQLGEQRPPRFTLLRGGAMTLRGRPWLSAAAAAVLVAAIGIATLGLPGDDAAIDDAETAAATSQSRAATTTTTTTSAASAADSDGGAASDSGSSTITAASSASVSDDDAAPAAVLDAAPEPTATQAPARVSTPTPTTATPAPSAAATPVPEPTPAQTVVVAPTPVAGQTPTRSDAGDTAEEADVAPAEVAEEAEVAADDADTMADADESMPVADDAGEDALEEADAEAVPPAPEATTFQDYERTAFIDTSIDAVSTFSLDTDRTSYFLALNWARNGYQVSPDSVRAEEWINAFDYGYDAPRDDRSFAITSDVVRHPLDDGKHLARIAFQAPELDDSTPLNVTLVLDASGSMNRGNRVAIAREAAETIRQSLGADDRIAVVHFTTEVIDAYTVEHSAPDDGDVVTSISALAPHDSTNVQAGLNLGVQLADQARRERPDAFNYVILMSDGVTNVDATDPFAILESAADTDPGNPLRLITIGVGIENYNDVLLEQLAQQGNGWDRYLENTPQAPTTFSLVNSPPQNHYLLTS
ncbi:MAG: von Willebrand factor type A domain-containing protein, partial [Chloroflexi bacterium]|nr:von Willebrand factor type A domain-containing protein [Chloroflexota bacterium]